MGLSATTTSAWIFVSFEPDLEFREHPDDSSREQKRVFFTYQRKKKGKGNVSLTSEVGNTKTAASLSSNLSGTDTGKFPSLPSGSVTKFLCVEDALRPIHEGTGIVVNDQTWVSYLDWEDFDVEDALA